MRRFMMLRRVDETGVSGTGHIADGVVFHDGTVVVRWRTATPGTTSFASLEHAKTVHGHDGKTVFEFHDWEPPIVWLCCMCFSDMDPPLNHCYQCGAGGSAVPMAKSQLEQIQTHDKQRLESIEKLHEELRAVRRVALDVYGPTALGLTVDRWTDADGAVRVSGIRQGRTTHGVYPANGEDDETFLRREGERVTLDPDHVRRLHAERRT
jgi:hypothetical protein